MTLLRLKYLKIYRDRHGTVRRYFRRSDRDLLLKGDPGTAEFMLAYQAALGARVPMVDETKAGTFARLITDYCRSAAFANRCNARGSHPAGAARDPRPSCTRPCRSRSG